MIFYLIIFIIILSFLVIAHEAGHFFFAKRAGLLVEEFGLGYPPRIFGKKIGETLYSINLIPFGGFVKIYGEEPTTETIKDPRSFWNQKPKVKAKVILGGVLVNFLIAIIIFYLVLGVHNFAISQPVLFQYKFPFCEKEFYPMVQLVAQDSPAQKAGIKEGDLIISVDHNRFSSLEAFIDYVNQHKGEPVLLEIQREGIDQLIQISVIPRVNPPKGEGPLAIGLVAVKKLDYRGFPSIIFSGILHSINVLAYSVYSLGKLIQLSFQEKSVEPIASSVSGVVGIFVITKLTIPQGIINTLMLIGLLSLALAFANILPIPALDGGRMIFVIYEGITKRKPSPEFEKKVNTVGFAFLILLLILITFKDIKQFKDFLF